MATFYVRSTDGNNSDNGSTWALAKATLSGAFSVASAGDTIYVSHVHAQTQASALTLTSPGTLGAPCKVICGNDGAQPPTAVATTATISTTGQNAITIEGCAVYYGITFSSADGSTPFGNGINVGTGLNTNKFISCVLKDGVTTGNYHPIVFGVYGNAVIFENTSLYLSGSTNPFQIVKFGTDGTTFVWKNTATPVQNAFPSLVFNVQVGTIRLQGLDLSNAGFNGATLIADGGFAGATLQIDNCKLHSGLVLNGLTQGAYYEGVSNSRSDSSGTNYRHDKYNFSGSQVVETTIVRTGGATDGTTPLATKIVTTANANFTFPYESIPLAIWNDTVSTNRVVTVYGIWGGGAVPNNDEIWIEVSYMGSSGSPIATINTANAKADYLTAAAGQASDSSTWGGSTTKFKMSVTLSSPQPALKGDIYVTVKAAKASSTFYIDPLIVLS